MNKKLGCMLGLAVGDALGSAVEFKYRDTFPIVTDLIGGGPFKLLPGQWTDDTSMALCSLQSFIDKSEFDPSDQMDKFLSWYLDGYMSSNGLCFDIGYTTMEAIEKWISDKSTPYHGNIHHKSAGNGSIMRLAPVPIYFADDFDKAIHFSAMSSKLTHGTRMCIDACKYMCGIILGAMSGESKSEILRARYHPIKGQWDCDELHPEILKIANGSFKDKKRHEIESSGWVIHTLEAALWAFVNSGTFESSLIKAVNLGYDSDTVGAVCGQISGAYYGYDNIPDRWLSKLTDVSKIVEMTHHIS